MDGWQSDPGSVFGKGTEFSLLQNVQTGSGTNPASCALDAGVSFADWGMTQTVRFPLMMSLESMWSYTSKPHIFVLWIGDAVFIWILFFYPLFLTFFRVSYISFHVIHIVKSKSWDKISRRSKYSWSQLPDSLKSSKLKNFLRWTEDLM